jgi:hypothetical protein
VFSSYLSPDVDGSHGLAWLKALLRLADHLASEKPRCAALMMQAAMMLSAQSVAIRDNRRTFLAEFSVAAVNPRLSPGAPEFSCGQQHQYPPASSSVCLTS